MDYRTASTEQIINELYFRLTSTRIDGWAGEWLDRKWYDFTGWLLTRRFGDDGRWGYELDRNPPPPPVRHCAVCGEVVELPGNHIQVNDDWYHIPCAVEHYVDE